MSDPAALRASDSERERVAEELREHFAVGRVDAEELAERLEIVYAAKRIGDLANALEDLPELPLPGGEQRRMELELERRERMRRGALQQAGGSLSAFSICAAIWLAAGAHGGFWPVWVLIAPVAFLSRIFWRLYGPEPELDRVEAELARRTGRRRRRHGGSIGRGSRWSAAALLGSPKGSLRREAGLASGERLQAGDQRSTAEPRPHGRNRV